MKKDDLIDFLVLAAQQGASDLHLTPGALPMIRVAGVIKPLTEDAAVLSAEDTRRLVIDALKEGQRAKLENEWQLDFALQVHDLGRYRGNACYVSGAIEANFRQIPAEIPDLNLLGHSPVVDRWCDERAGLILVTGASGEGKSTTLASMAQTIAGRRSVNMISIEDPIEFVHKNKQCVITQRQVGVRIAVGDRLLVAAELDEAVAGQPRPRIDRLGFEGGQRRHHLVGRARRIDAIDRLVVERPLGPFEQVAPLATPRNCLAPSGGGKHRVGDGPVSDALRLEVGIVEQRRVHREPVGTFLDPLEGAELALHPRLGRLEVRRLLQVVRGQVGEKLADRVEPRMQASATTANASLIS